MCWPGKWHLWRRVLTATLVALAVLPSAASAKSDVYTFKAYGMNIKGAVSPMRHCGEADPTMVNTILVPMFGGSERFINFHYAPKALEHDEFTIFINSATAVDFAGGPDGAAFAKSFCEARQLIWEETGGESGVAEFTWKLPRKARSLHDLLSHPATSVELYTETIASSEVFSLLANETLPQYKRKTPGAPLKTPPASKIESEWIRMIHEARKANP